MGELVLKLALSLLGMGVVIGGSILVMMHSWGLEVQSWGWVLGGTFLISMVGSVFQWSVLYLI